MGVSDRAREARAAAIGLTCQHHPRADAVGGLDIEQVVVMLARTLVPLTQRTENGVVVHDGPYTQSVLHVACRAHPGPVRQDGRRADDPRGTFDGAGNPHADNRQGRYPVAVAQLLDSCARGVKPGQGRVVDVQTDIQLADDAAALRWLLSPLRTSRCPW